MNKYFLNNHTSSPVGSDKSGSFGTPLGREDPGMKVRQVWRSWNNPPPLLGPPSSPPTIPLLSQAQGQQSQTWPLDYSQGLTVSAMQKGLKMLENLFVVVLLTFLLRKKDKINERSYLASISMRKLVEKHFEKHL